MPNGPGVLFVARTFATCVTGTDLRLLELGSYDPKGGLRALAELHGGFSEYIGVDKNRGPGVDVIGDVEDSGGVFRDADFDVVIACELLEHVRDWRLAVLNIKSACKPGGVIIITTRSKGYPYHAVPYDYWRFERDDMERIFSDCEILMLEEDPEAVGLFVTLRKPDELPENDLRNVCLYSMITRRMAADVGAAEFRRPRFILALTVSKCRQIIAWLFTNSRRNLGETARWQAREILNLLNMFKPNAVGAAINKEGGGRKRKSC